jgi:glycine cleavage system aminomethyltransferase T
VLALDGPRLMDSLGRPSYVTSAGSGPSVGTHLLMAYLPSWSAAPGTKLLVEYMGEQYPVTVAGQGAVFDPSGSRMR